MTLTVFQHFRIHAVSYGVCCEGMTEGMKVFFNVRPYNLARD